MPPAGLTFSRTTEMETEPTGEGLHVTIGGGPVLADYMGDFVLSIDVPDDVARQYEALYDDPEGWPFREYWLPPEIADAHRETLAAFVSELVEDGPVDLAVMRAEHSVFVTERLTRGFLQRGDTDLTFTAGALCLCGERWRWAPASDADPEATFAAWSDQHGG